MIFALDHDLSVEEWIRMISRVEDEPEMKATICRHSPDWYRLSVNGLSYWVIDLELEDVLGYLRREGIEVCWA
jgi:hypothetical protein